jgi:AraC-like DNA-binding protein
VTVVDAARHLGMSERTLRRQLSQLGTSYADLVQQTQQLLAERLLAEQRLSIKQVADELGFASVSTFHRAFRRWTGHTPAGWQGARRA